VEIVAFLLFFFVLVHCFFLYFLEELQTSDDDTSLYARAQDAQAAAVDSARRRRRFIKLPTFRRLFLFFFFFCSPPHSTLEPDENVCRLGLSLSISLCWKSKRLPKLLLPLFPPFSMPLSSAVVVLAANEGQERAEGESMRTWERATAERMEQ
jgi:hypothetical protein